MKMEDNHERVKLDLSYEEAEYIYCVLSDAKEFCEMHKKQAKAVDSAIDKLEEYINT